MDSFHSTVFCSWADSLHSCHMWFWIKKFKCCFTSTETVQTKLKDKARTATSTVTQLLSSAKILNQWLYPFKFYCVMKLITLQRKNWYKCIYIYIYTCIVHTSGNETVAYQCHQTVCISHSSNCQTQCHIGYSFVTPATMKSKIKQWHMYVISLNCLQYCTDYNTYFLLEHSI